MASVWGTSWGITWGNSWGATSVATGYDQYYHYRIRRTHDAIAKRKALHRAFRMRLRTKRLRRRRRVRR